MATPFMLLCTKILMTILNDPVDPFQCNHHMAGGTDCTFRFLKTLTIDLACLLLD